MCCQVFAGMNQPINKKHPCKELHSTLATTASRVKQESKDNRQLDSFSQKPTLPFLISLGPLQTVRTMPGATTGPAHLCGEPGTGYLRETEAGQAAKVEPSWTPQASGPPDSYPTRGGDTEMAPAEPGPCSCPFGSERQLGGRADQAASRGWAHHPRGTQLRTVCSPPSPSYPPELPSSALSRPSSVDMAAGLLVPAAFLSLGEKTDSGKGSLPPLTPQGLCTNNSRVLFTQAVVSIKGHINKYHRLCRPYDHSQPFTFAIVAGIS